MTAEASPPQPQAVPLPGPALTAGTAPATVRVFPGRSEQAKAARGWVRALASAAGLTDTHEVELIVTELFANALVHTRSGRAGGKVTVTVTADGVIHIHDFGPAGPCPGLAAGPRDTGREDFGRGLEIAAALSAGLAHLPAAWCSAGGPDDPAVAAGGCCTCCRPAAWPQPGAAPDQKGTCP